jgi:hypothetical protein
MELRARYNKELNALVAQLISRIDSNLKDQLTLTEVNTFLSQISNTLARQRSIDKTKLTRFTVSLHKFCRDFFKNRANLSRIDIKDSLTSLKDRVEWKTAGSLDMLVEIGYDAPSMNGKESKNIIHKLIELDIKFNGPGDSMIAGEFFSILESHSTEQFEFAAFDHDFIQKIEGAKQKLNFPNLNIVDIARI